MSLFFIHIYSRFVSNSVLSAVWGEQCINEKKWRTSSFVYHNWICIVYFFYTSWTHWIVVFFCRKWRQRESLLCNNALQTTLSILISLANRRPNETQCIHNTVKVINSTMQHHLIELEWKLLFTNPIVNLLNLF